MQPLLTLSVVLSSWVLRFQYSSDWRPRAGVSLMASLYRAQQSRNEMAYSATGMYGLGEKWSSGIPQGFLASHWCALARTSRRLCALFEHAGNAAILESTVTTCHATLFDHSGRIEALRSLERPHCPEADG